MDLALACGYPHPRHMMEDLSRDEYYELLAYSEIKPIGRRMLEAEFALTRFYGARVMADKKSANKFKLVDFYLVNPEKSGDEEKDELKYMDGTLMAMLKPEGKSG